MKNLLVKFLIGIATLQLVTCASYEASVHSRSVGVFGYAKDDRVGGQLNYTVTY